MGEVWEAEDTSLRPAVAVKILRAPKPAAAAPRKTKRNEEGSDWRSIALGVGIALGVVAIGTPIVLHIFGSRSDKTPPPPPKPSTQARIERERACVRG